MRSARIPRLLIVLVSFVLIVAACGDDDGLLSIDEGVTDDGSTGGGEPGSGDVGGGDVGEGAGDATGGDDGATPPTSNDGGADEDPADPGPTPASLLGDDRGRVGAMGRALLRPEIGAVVVEVEATPGQAVSDRTLGALRDRLSTHGGKSVDFATVGEAPSNDVWTADEIRTLAHDANATSDESRIVLHLLVLDGRSENESAIGVAVDATTMAIFPERYRGGLVGQALSGDVETAVVVHELGHLFGLVNLTGHGAFHEDAEHPGHSNSRGSVMFWAVESDVVTTVFEGGPPNRFDDADLQEMDAIRAG